MKANCDPITEKFGDGFQLFIYIYAAGGHYELSSPPAAAPKQACLFAHFQSGPARDVQQPKASPLRFSMFAPAPPEPPSPMAIDSHEQEDSGIGPFGSSPADRAPVRNEKVVSESPVLPVRNYQQTPDRFHQYSAGYYALQSSRLLRRQRRWGLTPQCLQSQRWPRVAVLEGSLTSARSKFAFSSRIPLHHSAEVSWLCFSVHFNHY